MLEASLQEPSNQPVWSELPGPASTAPANRILIVMHDFSGGGTERVAIRLANQWARLGRNVHIFCGNETGPARSLVAPGVTVEQADPPLPRSLFSRIRLGWALAEAAARFAPDAVFGPGNFHLLVLAAFARRDRSGAAIFCKISNPLIRAGQYGVRAWLRRRVLKALTDRVDSLIAMSPALRAEAEALVEPGRVTSQWEPIFDTPPDPVEESEREPGLIVAVGRLEPQKNFALAIRTMEHLGRWTDARLVILGEGAERARLTELVTQLGLEGRVLLPGHVGEIKPWLRRASCFLMTSHYEGYPAALVEALACGAPTLVTPCSPALTEILPHASIGMIVSSDAETIACALQALLRRPRPQNTGPMLLARHDEARVATSYLELMDRPWRPAVRHALWSMHAR